MFEQLLEQEMGPLWALFVDNGGQASSIPRVSF